MSYAIPKIQYKNTDNVNGYTELENEIVLDSLVGVEIGMNFFGNGVPVDTTILSIDVPSSKVVLSKNVTPTLGEFFSWAFELKFRFPPKINDNFENAEPDQTISTSRSGHKQFLTRFIELARPIEFGFLNLAETKWLETMFKNWFSLGEFVRWFDDQNSENFVEYQAADTKFKPRFMQGTNELYDLKINFVRLK